MMTKIFQDIFRGIYDFMEAIREINAKYRTPRIKMTRLVSFWLLMLRLYLIGMILLLVYKFITIVSVH
jgi:hypothetical protein